MCGSVCDGMYFAMDVASQDMSWHLRGRLVSLQTGEGMITFRACVEMAVESLYVWSCLVQGIVSG